MLFIFKISVPGIYGETRLSKERILEIQLLKVNQNIAGISKKSRFRKEKGIINRFSGVKAVNGDEKNTFCLPDVRVSVVEVDGKVPQL